MRSCWCAKRRGDEAALEGGKHEAALEVHQAEEPEHQAEEPEHQAEEPAEEERPKTAVEEPDHHDTPVHEAENAEEPQQQVGGGAGLLCLWS